MSRGYKIGLGVLIAFWWFMALSAVGIFLQLYEVI